MAAVLAVVVASEPDILLLQGFDHDAGGAALGAFADALESMGQVFPYRLALRPNTGWPTGHDLDGDGETTGARDAHGYGWFSGSGGMALLSRHPIAAVRDFTTYLWRDLPESHAPEVTPVEALVDLRLHSVAAWDVEIDVAGRSFHLLATHASAPVFDGPEDRNGLRNADELRFWSMYLDGWAPDASLFEATDFALIGTLNLDPEGGEGRRAALQALLDHPRLQDPAPARPGGGWQTADWQEPAPGDLRVDYILPAASLAVIASGVVWPEGDDAALPLSTVALASAHRLVWVDLDY